MSGFTTSFLRCAGEALAGDRRNGEVFDEVPKTRKRQNMLVGTLPVATTLADNGKRTAQVI
jgi:hypothetical protein